MNKLNITLEVFLLPSELEEAEDMGVNVKLEDCILVPHVFYSIDYIRPLADNKYCQISSGGDLFSVNESFQSVTSKINERLTFLYN